jgi:hypothetical protein
MQHTQLTVNRRVAPGSTHEAKFPTVQACTSVVFLVSCLGNVNYKKTKFIPVTGRGGL